MEGIVYRLMEVAVWWVRLIWAGWGYSQVGMFSYFALDLVMVLKLLDFCSFIEL